MERTKSLKTMRVLIAIMLVFAVAFTFLMPQTAYAAVKINKSKMTLTVGETGQLKVKGTKKKIIWSSSGRDVAAVSSKGLVSAKSKGKAKIYARYGSKIKTCMVTVVDKIKAPIVVRKQYIKAQKKVIVLIKNENAVSVSGVVEMKYIDPSNTMVVETQRRDVPVIEANQYLCVEYDATLQTGSVPIASVIEVSEAASRPVSKVSRCTISSAQKEPGGTYYTIKNTSDVDLDNVELMVLFKNKKVSSWSAVGGCTKVTLDSLKAGESQKVFAKVPSSVPSNAYYYVTRYLNYAYAE